MGKVATSVEPKKQQTFEYNSRETGTMKKNTMKTKLLSGQPVIGFLLRGNWPEVVEMLGLVGADYVMLDAEHGIFDVPQMANLVRAAECAGITPLARIPRNDTDVIPRYLDQGVQGIIVPHVNTREEAEQAVRATKYTPEGERGFGSWHATDYGLLSIADYIEMANRETMVIIMCESKQGVDNLEEIVEVRGIDIVMIGATDLSLSLGIPGQFNDPLEKEAITRAKRIALRAGKVVCMGARDGDRARELIAENARCILSSVHDFITSGAREYLVKARASST